MSRDEFLDVRTPLNPRRIAFWMISSLLAGSGMLAAAVHTGGNSAPGLAFFGLALPIMGFTLPLSRVGVQIDAAAGTVITWWGLVVPLRRTSQSLGNPEYVSLTREIRGSERNRSAVYPVRLIEQGSGAARELLASHRYDDSRRMGEQIAFFLKVALHDAT